MRRTKVATALTLAAFDGVRTDLLVQVGAFDAEEHRGARDVPSGAAERVDDVLALGLLAELAQRERLAGGRYAGVRARRGVEARLGRRRRRARGGGGSGRGQDRVVVGVRALGALGVVVERARVRVFGQVR